MVAEAKGLTMTLYYRLNVQQDDDPIAIDIVSHDDYSFVTGMRFASPFPEPVVFEIDPEIDGTRVPTLFLPEPVFRADLLEALRRAGVTNIDDYAALIVTERDSTHEAVTGYRAVNIIGLVDCADRERSEFDEIEGMMMFDKLVIDASRAAGCDFFRVAEAEEYIVVSSPLAAKLDLGPFPDVVLEPIET